MLKKFLAIVSLLCLIVVQAHAVSNNGLKAAFDELNYSLSVEWDQKDQAFYDAKVAEFNSEIEALQKAGLSNQELVDYALSQVKDQKLANDLEKTFALVELNKMSPEQAKAHVKKLIDQSYNRGASWSGEVIHGGAILVIIILIVVVVAHNSNGDDIQEEEECKEWECCYGNNSGRGWGDNCCYPSANFGGGHCW